MTLQWQYWTDKQGVNDKENVRLIATNFIKSVSVLNWQPVLIESIVNWVSCQLTTINRTCLLCCRLWGSGLRRHGRVRLREQQPRGPAPLPPAGAVVPLPAQVPAAGRTLPPGLLSQLHRGPPPPAGGAGAALRTAGWGGLHPAGRASGACGGERISLLFVCGFDLAQQRRFLFTFECHLNVWWFRIKPFLDQWKHPCKTGFHKTCVFNPLFTAKCVGPSTRFEGKS